MENPAISVIVPVYNIEEVLPDCIQSLLGQSFPHFEVLLIDDGSTDGSGALCRRAAEQDERFTVYRQVNAGLSAARNAGIERAKGEYLFFLDGDDSLPPEALRLLWEAARRTGADLVCGRMAEQYGKMLRPANHPTKAALLTGREVQRSLFSPEITHYSCDKLYRATLFRAVRFPVGKYFEDSFTTPQIFMMAESLYLLPETIYYYRRRSGSITRTPGKSYVADRIEGAAFCERLVRERCPELSETAHERWLLAHLRTLDLILQWPHFRASPCWESTIRFVRQHRREFMGAATIRRVRKIYLLGVIMAPDLVSLLLRFRRRREERLCRQGEGKEA